MAESSGMGFVLRGGDAMKRSPLPPRTKPIARGKRPKAKRPGPARRVSVVRSQCYMDWLKSQYCVACVALNLATGMHERSARWYAGGICEPAHTANNNGRSSKGPDDSCIPLCHQHHAEMDGRAGTKVVTKEQFAAKYNLDLAAIAAEHYARFKQEQPS